MKNGTHFVQQLFVVSRIAFLLRGFYGLTDYTLLFSISFRATNC